MFCKCGDWETSKYVSNKMPEQDMDSLECCIKSTYKQFYLPKKGKQTSSVIGSKHDLHLEQRMLNKYILNYVRNEKLLCFRIH